MPRRIFKRYMPHPDRIRQNPSLRFLGHLMHDPNLFHLNRHSVSRAMAIGLFWALIPIPMQMLAATVVAIMLRGNLPISVGLVWLTNPLTMPPIFYATYKLGALLMGLPGVEFPEELSMEWFTNELSVLWRPLFLGSFVAASLSALLAYFGTQWYWRHWVNRSWEKRRLRKKS